jgi:hypothetical protein
MTSAPGCVAPSTESPTCPVTTAGIADRQRGTSLRTRSSDGDRADVGLSRILGRVDGMAVAFENRRHRLTKNGLVVHHEDAIHGRDSFPSGDRT